MKTLRLNGKYYTGAKLGDSNDLTYAMRFDDLEHVETFISTFDFREYLRGYEIEDLEFKLDMSASVESFNNTATEYGV